LKKDGEHAARRALKIAVLFQRHRGVRVAPNMRRFGIAFSGRLALRNSVDLRSLCAVEHRAGSERGQCDYGNNDKGQITLHKLRAGERKVSAQRTNRQVRKSMAAGVSPAKFTWSQPTHLPLQSHKGKNRQYSFVIASFYIRTLSLLTGLQL
jgi:hypothetical protein